MRCTQCSCPVRPVVVFDIDGTLAMYHDAVQEFSAQYYGTECGGMTYDGSVPFREFLGLTQAEHRAMKLAYRQGGNKRFVPAYLGASEAVAAVRAMGAEIWVATTRPFNRLDNVDPDTREWLRRNNIEIDGLLFGEDKYQQLIETVDQDRIVMVFEDLPDMIGIGKALGLPMFQVHRRHNSSVRYPGGTLSQGVEFTATQIERWRVRNG